MLLQNRPLLWSLLAIFTILQLSFGQALWETRFDWRPMWDAPVARATLLDFTFTVGWCAFYLLDTARRQRRNAWAWIPLLLILPTAALFLFSLTSPRNPPADAESAPP